MTSVRWLSLELSGFGVYDDVRIDFPAGSGVLIAPNESGKSTALAGLTAVLFGLPTNSDPTAWGTARYRSYSSSARFAGRVEFVARDGGRYEVRRDFDGHEVGLVRLEPDRATLFSGKHNPGARKASGKYEDLLAELLGMTSAELFRQTFSIEQPLRGEGGLSQEVAGLLAGSGGGSHQAALDHLAAQVERRTRYTADLGLPGRNKNKDRELEELDERIRSLEQRIAEGRTAADGLQRVQLELVELEGELARLRTREEELNTRERSARAWLERQEAHSRAQRQLSELQGRFEKARSQSERLEELERPSERELSQPERDWEFAGTGAVAYLRGRKEDAGDALEEYRLFREAASEAAERRRALVRYRSLQDAPSGLLEELRTLPRSESRLEQDVDLARRHLDEIERHLRANDPVRGFEDVAELTEAGAELLHASSRLPRGAWLLGALIGAAAGAGAGILTGVALPLLVGLSVAGLAIGLTVSTLPGRERRRAAKERLRRYEELQRRKAVAEVPDLTPYQERLDRAEAELAAFRERVRPFREEFDDLGSAVAEFSALGDEATELEAAAARYARDHWGVGPSDVDSADPLGAEGCWARCAAFLQAIGRESGTVAQVVAALRSLDWEGLEADARSWDEVTRARSAREQEQARALAVVRNLLEADGVGDLDEFRRKLTEKQTEALAERSAFMEVCELDPALPRADEAGERRGEVAELRSRYAAELEALGKEIEELVGRIQELYRERAEKQGQNPVNIAALELELEALRLEREELRLEAEAYALAFTSLEEASREYQELYLERLAETATGYFREFTGDRARTVVFGDGFRVAVLEEGGEELDPQRLSQGAQDQLALALRLAIADTIGGDAHLPLVFDDPFLNCDAERLERIGDALARVSAERQVILLSHEERFESWGEPLTITGRAAAVQGALPLVGSRES